MSDPFEQLRFHTDDDVAAPDVDAIKSRARKIVRRRQVVLGGAAAVIAAIALIGIVAIPGDEEPTQLAQREEGAEQGEEAYDYAQEDAARVEGRSGGSAVKKDLPAQRSRARDRTEVAGGGPAAAVGSAAGPTQLEATVTVEEGTVTDRGAKFTLKVCNPGPQAVTRDFPTAQRYDFEVRRGDDLVWRWSDGRTFAQVLGRETWKPKECKTWMEDWNAMTSSGAPASSGRYEAVGILKSSEPQKTKPESFCLDLC